MERHKVKLAHYFNSALIFFIDEACSEAVLGKMVEEIWKSGEIEDRVAFYRAIMERERIVSTGIGMGIAIPHARLTAYDRFFIACARLKKGVEWNAIDGAPVRLVFMIGGPDGKQTEYLQILSSLTAVIKQEEVRKTLLAATTTSEIFDYCSGW